jgi:hypothetical protein
MADARIHLPSDWDPEIARRNPPKPRHLVTPTETARRLMNRWEMSGLHDASLRKLMKWMRARRIPVVLHQLPVSPEVATLIESVPDYAASYAEFGSYHHSLHPKPDAVHRVLGLDEIGLGSEGMADRTHLNRLGAVAYSKQLAERLRPIPLARVSKSRRKAGATRVADRPADGTAPHGVPGPARKSRGKPMVEPPASGGGEAAPSLGKPAS